jgi:hypothetical protein
MYCVYVRFMSSPLLPSALYVKLRSSLWKVWEQEVGEWRKPEVASLGKVGENGQRTFW